MQLTDWVDGEALAAWVHDATEAVTATVADFAPDDRRWLGPPLDTVNPPVWELAHVAWFAEWFVLRQLHGHPPMVDGVDALYDSSRVPHATRWALEYPGGAGSIDYLRRVGDDLVGVVDDDRGLDSTAAYVAYAVMHHDAHFEALMTTRQTLNWGPLDRRGLQSAAAEPGTIESAEANTVADESTARAPMAGDRTVPGGRYVIGASRHQPFVMDNEKWAHAVELDRFALAAVPVTVAQYAEFVNDGGYADDRLWSPDGLTWRHRVGATAPVYWRRGDHGWQRRIGSAWEPIEVTAQHPMAHVCWWEADAFCRWADRRLPTEAEWEVAATTGPNGRRRPWFPWGDRDPAPGEAVLDARTGGTVPVDAFGAGDGPWGHRQLIGNVWEWTASVFAPYPHFEPDAYRDNSEPWFFTRRVLKGGSWATRHRYVRSTYRNYFEPHRRDLFAGFRTCAR